MDYIFNLDSALPTNTNCRNQPACFQPNDCYKPCHDILHLNMTVLWEAIRIMQSSRQAEISGEPAA